jgi:hypothetical protein
LKSTPAKKKKKTPKRADGGDHVVVCVCLASRKAWVQTLVPLKGKKKKKLIFRT